MNHQQLIAHYGSGMSAATELGVSPSLISSARDGATPHKPLSSALQIRAMNLSGGKLMPDEKALAFARNLFPNGVANSPLARLLDAQ